MEHNTKIKIGNYVQFLYRKNQNLQLLEILFTRVSCLFTIVKRHESLN
ncbi:hypothetical protein [Bacillus thuringiensis]|nr:hypothetical protein [Bacillus thuringiensis]